MVLTPSSSLQSLQSEEYRSPERKSISFADLVQGAQTVNVTSSGRKPSRGKDLKAAMQAGPLYRQYADQVLFR